MTSDRFQSATSFRCLDVWQVKAFLVAAVVSLSLSEDSSATTFYVRTSGDDANSGRTAALAFRTISKACDEANVGDTIYVGAGTYLESCPIRSKYSTSAVAALTVHADLDGEHTGDAGNVVVRPSDKRWAFDIDRCGRVIISGFVIDPTASTDRYGFRIRQSDLVTLEGCAIRRCRYGIYSHSTQLVIHHCSVLENRQGIRLVDSPEVVIRGSTLTNNRYSVVAKTIDRLTVEQTQFIDRDATTKVRGLHAVDAGLILNGCQFSQTNIGIYGTRIRSAEITGCQFMQSDSHAVYLAGSGMHVSECNFHQNHRSITLDAPKETPVLTNLKITESRIGIVARSNDYEFQDVRIEDCRIGIHQRKENRLLSIDTKEKVTLHNNEYAIYANTIGATHDALLRVSGVDLRGNDRAILAYNSAAEIENCLFAGSTYAVAVLRSDRMLIEDSIFEGNPNAANQCRFAIRSDAQDVRIKQCSIGHCRIGTLLDTPQSERAIIRDSVFHDIEFTAIYLRDGIFNLRGSDRVTIKRCRRGIFAQRTTWSASDLAFDDSVDYPFMDYDGSCHIDRVTSSGSQVGVYASRSKSLSVAETVISGCERHGLVAVECHDVRFSNVSARQNQNGFYVRNSTGGHVAIEQCEAEQNRRYGFLFAGISPQATKRNVARGNVYGLLVQDDHLTIDDGSVWQITGNRYGIIHRRGRAHLRHLQLPNNHVGFYAIDSDVDAEQLAITSGYYGLVVHANETVSVRDSVIRGSQRGIYVATRKQSCDINLESCVVDQCKGHAVYLRDAAAVGLRAEIDQLRVNQTQRGVTLVNCETRLSRSQLMNVAGTALYQVGGILQMRGCSIGSVAQGWGVLAKGERSVLDRISIRDAKRGIALQSQASSIRNTTVANCDYGIYVHAPDSFNDLEFLTVANAKTVGLYRREGSLRVTNCIFQASRLGIYNTSGAGRLTHHHNLIDAGRPLVGTEAGENERFESPVFVDAAAGNLQLGAGSPAINAGTESKTLVDFEGNERPSFEGFEMGAHEYMFPDGSIKIMQWDELAGG